MEPFLIIRLDPRLFLLLVTVLMCEGVHNFDQLVDGALPIVPHEHTVSSSCNNWMMLEFFSINVSLVDEVLGVKIGCVKGKELIVSEFIWLGKDFLLNFLNKVLFSIVWKVCARVVEENDKGVSFFCKHVLDVSTFLFRSGRKEED